MSYVFSFLFLCVVDESDEQYDDLLSLPAWTATWTDGDLNIVTEASHCCLSLFFFPRMPNSSTRSFLSLLFFLWPLAEEMDGER